MPDKEVNAAAFGILVDMLGGGGVRFLPSLRIPLPLLIALVSSLGLDACRRPGPPPLFSVEIDPLSAQDMDMPWAFDPDGSTLTVVDSDLRVKIIDLASQTVVHEFTPLSELAEMYRYRDRKAAMPSVTLVGSRFAAAVFRAETSTESTSFIPNTLPSPPGFRMSATTRVLQKKVAVLDSTIFILETDAGKVAELSPPEGKYFAANLENPDASRGTFVARAMKSSDGQKTEGLEVLSVDLSNLEVDRIDAVPKSLALSTQGSRFYCEKRSCRVVNCTGDSCDSEGTALRGAPVESVGDVDFGPLARAAFSPDGDTLATMDGCPELDDRNIYLWSVHDGSLKSSFKGPNDICGAHLSYLDNNTLIVQGFEDATTDTGKYYLYSTADGRLVRTIAHFCNANEGEGEFIVAPSAKILAQLCVAWGSSKTRINFHRIDDLLSD